jgi:hypothetical protein
MHELIKEIPAVYLRFLYVGIWCAILFACYLMSHRRVRKWLLRRKVRGVIFEIILILFSLLLLDTHLIGIVTGSAGQAYQLAFFSHYYTAVALYPLFFLFFCLLFVFFTRTAWDYLLMMGLSFGVLGGYLHFQQLGWLEEKFLSLDRYPSELYERLFPDFWVTTSMMNAISVLLLIAPIIVCLCLYRYTRSRWLYFSVFCLMSIGVSFGLLGPFIGYTLSDVFFKSLALVLLGALFLHLPHLRRRIKNYIFRTNISESKGSSKNSLCPQKTRKGTEKFRVTPCIPWTKMVFISSFIPSWMVSKTNERIKHIGAVSCLLLGAILPPLLSINGGWNECFQKMIYPKEKPHYAGEVSAFDQLDGSVYYYRPKEEESERLYDMDDFSASKVKPLNMETIKYLIENREEMTSRQYFSENKYELDLITTHISEFDYLPTMNNHSQKRISLTAFSDVCKLLFLRATCNLEEGNHDVSLGDIRTCLRLGSLMTEGQLIEVQVGSGVRKVGLNAAWNYVAYYQNDPEALRAMAQCLEEYSNSMKVVFPVEEIQFYEHTQSGMGLVPLEHFRTPNYGYVETFFEGGWSRFDQIQLTMMLLLYRHDRGEWPETLDELVPEYINRLPLDPSNGQPYIYLLHENGGIELQRPLGPDETLTDREKMRLPYPVGGEIDCGEKDQ